MSKSNKLSPVAPTPAKALGYTASTASDVATHAVVAVPRGASGNLAKAIDCAQGYGNGGSARPPRGGSSGY